MKPIVSVVIPVYQVKLYLAHCLDSVINQNYNELEIIVIDDGSTDGSELICDQYAAKDSRIKVIHQKNSGLSVARNMGIKESRGEYITFVDSDDIVSLEMVEEMVSLATKEDADVVKIGVIRKYSIEECASVLKGYTVQTGLSSLHLLFSSNSQIVCGCGKLFRRDIIANTRFPVGRYFEDEYFVPRIYARAKKVVLSDSELYFYMQRDNDSILRGIFTQKKAQDSIWVSQDRLSFFATLEDPILLKKAKMDYFFKIQSLINRATLDGNNDLLPMCDELLELRKIFIRENRMLYLQIQGKLFAHRQLERLRSQLD